jgi:hypothetical protein
MLIQCYRPAVPSQVREAAAAAGVPVGGENALPCFMPNIIDETALHRIVYNTQASALLAACTRRLEGARCCFACSSPLADVLVGDQRGSCCNRASFG